MKKIFPYILILTIIVQLFAPFTVGSGVKNNLGVRANKAEAEWTGCNTLDDYKKAFSPSMLNFNGSIVNPDTSDTTIDIKIKLDTGFDLNTDSTSMWMCADYPGAGNTIIGNSANNFADDDFILLFKEESTGKIGYYDVTKDILIGNMDKRMDIHIPVSIERDISVGTASHPLIPVDNGLDKFSPNLEYTVSLYYQAFAGSLIGGSSPADNNGEDILGDNDKDYFVIKSTTFNTATVTQGFNGNVGTGEIKKVAGVVELPECRIDFYNTLGGCFGVLLYKVVFVPTSFIFAKTGQLLDFTVDYSIRDKSYRSSFVVEGWGVVRDFCNMFFIFVLLYIAFGTILNLHGVKTKEMIINVVIIGLLINFSLFATQIIIDASNILTRVFYNTNTIEVGIKVEGVIKNEVGPNGEIKLSEAIVGKINPQNLLMQANEINNIPIKGAPPDETSSNGISAGSFILVVILASAINIVGLWVFLTSSFIFIIRVVGLWFAMILAPLAFFSYIVPAMQDWEMVGWKKWWPDTLKMAFLAPIFVFFMYLIIKFLETGLGIAQTLGADKSKMDLTLSIFVPFIFIMVLLLKAKDIAKNLSGKIGESTLKFGAVAGGIALGAATGGAAMLGRQTIGRWAANVAQSNKFRDWAGRSKIGASALKMTSGVASGSFDARGVKIAGKGLGDTGLKNIGKAKEGGFAKIREEKVKKEEEFANKLLDTSDYGMAKLIGQKGMSERKKNRIIKEMNGNFGTDKNGAPINEQAFRAKLQGGLSAKDARDVADQLNSTRRENRAKKFENSIFVTNRIKANKIRKKPEDFDKARKLATTMAALATAQKATEGGSKPSHATPPASTTHTPTTPSTPSSSHSTH